MERSTTCCFTGHRPDKLPWGDHEDDPRCVRAKEQIAQALERAYGAGYRHFMCGMAKGSDLYFAQAVLELRERRPEVTLEGVRPCENQADSWTAEEKARYWAILDQCNYETLVQHHYDRYCMMRRNRYMADRSARIIALYNGEPKGGTAQTWLGNGTSAIAVIVFINTWQFVGVSMVIYLAGIQGVSQSYIEAATVDGANAWERFRYIILPLLVPALSSSVIYNLIGGLKLYDVIIALTDGGPARKTHSLATYIANRYFDAERAGYAAAIGVFSFVMIMIISMIVNGYFRRKEVEV